MDIDKRIVIFAIICVFLAASALFQAEYLLGVIWSLVHGGTSVAYWNLAGFSLIRSLGIAVMFSSVAVILKFWFIDAIVHFWTGYFPPKRKFPSRWRIRFYRLAMKLPYPAIFFSVFYPGSTWLGIVLAKYFKLNKIASISILIAASDIKLIAFGTGLVALMRI